MNNVLTPFRQAVAARSLLSVTSRNKQFPTQSFRRTIVTGVRMPSSILCSRPLATPRPLPSSQSLTFKRTFLWRSNAGTTPESVASSAAASLTPSESFVRATPDVVESTAAYVAKTEDLPAAASTSVVDPTIPSFIAQETVDATQTTLQAVERLGDLKTIGLGGWGPTGMAQNLLELVHVTSGLPWWGTIMVTTLAIRVALFPLMVKVQRTATKMHNISHIAKPLQNDMQRYTSQGDMAQAQKTRQKLADLYKSEGVNPFGAILAFAQIPVFMSFFFGLKAMADLPVPGLSTGGFGWVTDLTLPDSTYILPVAANLGMLAVMEAQAKSGGAAAMQSPTMKNVFRGFMVIAIFLTAKFPAAMFMYWVSSNIFTLLQSLLFRQPAVRRMLNIPTMNKAITPPQPTVTQIERLTLSRSSALLKQAAEQRVADAAGASKTAPIKPIRR